jgi:DNA polymerase
MEAWRRNEYLKAIGIDVWVPRPGGLLDRPRPVPEPLAAASYDGAQAIADAQPAAPAPHAPEAATEPALVHTADASDQAAAVYAPAADASRQQQFLSSDSAESEWAALRSEVLQCTRCSLHSTRTQGVFGVGNTRADWLIIGEAPGAEEDRKGEPFVGRAGHLLDAMLRSIGLSRATNVYIANVLKSRPPGNRDPKPEEVAACLPYLLRQIALLRPRLMLAVGRIAAQNLLGTEMSLGRLRGMVHHFGELNTPLIVTYHPAYLLRSPADKRKAWEDLKFARRVFRQLTESDRTDGHSS